MTRHARNSTAGTVYTYHERQKDTKSSGYGSKKVRMGKDSVKEFDCCCLTLQPCRNPVVTQDGYLFDKEAILEYIIHQKKENAKKLKEFEKQKSKLQEEKAQETRAEHETKVKSFIAKESSIMSKPYDPFKKDGAPKPGSSICNMKEGKEKDLPSFWIPSLTPQSKPTLVKKPDEKVRCPMSGKPIKMKDLINVKFTPIKDGDTKTALISKHDRYVCAVTNDVLGNSVPCCVLRTSGNVVTMECYEKIIKKDMLDPLNGAKMKEKDVIPLQRGATSFSGSGLTLEAKKDGPGLQG